MLRGEPLLSYLLSLAPDRLAPVSSQPGWKQFQGPALLQPLWSWTQIHTLNPRGHLTLPFPVSTTNPWGLPWASALLGECF